jgi:hypothetical protein
MRLKSRRMAPRPIHIAVHVRPRRDRHRPRLRVLRLSGEEIGSFAAVAATVLATLLVTYLCLARSC